ncbi:hypothetical protein P5G50_06970 [Leifsonia sp. F6_8S_P_1B]|uniref:Uncharacterized protein n=1 Tax=Leifsonia williamsii TaxID=3035919 RepID=A0ABT8K9S3_9MICO|nr:hypothetical protein [Leifsonia williamsii]MDN4614193.1 hypothetical protein [Leifsonia williamsii]
MNENAEQGRDADRTQPVESGSPTAPTASTVPLPPAEPWLTPAPFGAADTAGEARPAGRAPVRWGGVVWGALLVLFAAGTLWVLSAPSRLAAWDLWVSTLTTATAWALGIAVVGMVIVVSGLLGAIRSAQRRRVGG